MATTKKETEIIAIPAIDIRNATITLKGDSPLIVHKWSEKAKKMMLDKQMKVATTKGHDAKDPFADFVDTIYFLSGKPEREQPRKCLRKLFQTGHGSASPLSVSRLLRCLLASVLV